LEASLNDFGMVIEWVKEEDGNWRYQTTY